MTNIYLWFHISISHRLYNRCGSLIRNPHLRHCDISSAVLWRRNTARLRKTSWQCLTPRNAQGSERMDRYGSMTAQILKTLQVHWHGHLVFSIFISDDLKHSIHLHAHFHSGSNCLGSFEISKCREALWHFVTQLRATLRSDRWPGWVSKSNHCANRSRFRSFGFWHPAWVRLLVSCSGVALKFDDYFQQQWQEDRDALEWFQPRANPRMQILASNHVPTSGQEFLSPAIFVFRGQAGKHSQHRFAMTCSMVAPARAAGPSVCGLL